MTHRTRRKHPVTPRGTSLIELLVVISIIGMLIALSVVGYGYLTSRMARESTKVTLDQVEQIADEYYAVMQRHVKLTGGPDGLTDEFIESVENVGRIKQMLGSLGDVLDETGADPKIVDGWGKEIYIDAPGDERPRFWSAGQDGQDDDGGDDDVTSRGGGE